MTTHQSEWQKSRELTIATGGEDEKQQERACIADGNAKIEQPLGKSFYKFLIKLSTLLPYNPAIAFLAV